MRRRTIRSWHSCAAERPRPLGARHRPRGGRALPPAACTSPAKPNGRCHESPARRRRRRRRHHPRLSAPRAVAGRAHHRHAPCVRGEEALAAARVLQPKRAVLLADDTVANLVGGLRRHGRATLFDQGFHTPRPSPVPPPWPRTILPPTPPAPPPPPPPLHPSPPQPPTGPPPSNGDSGQGDSE